MYLSVSYVFFKRISISNNCFETERKKVPNFLNSCLTLLVECRSLVQSKKDDHIKEDENKNLWYSLNDLIFLYCMYIHCFIKYFDNEKVALRVKNKIL